jgi:hypothetical protein
VTRELEREKEHYRASVAMRAISAFVRPPRPASGDFRAIDFSGQASMKRGNPSNGIRRYFH